MHEKPHRPRHGVLLWLSLVALVTIAAFHIPAFLQAGSAFLSIPPACTPIGGRGVTPDLSAVGTDPFQRYEAWHKTNPPCIPDTWVPQGCSYAVIDEDRVNAGYTRYPYHFMDAGAWPASVSGMDVSAYLDNAAGVQTLKCGTNFRELWWSHLQTGLYHELSAVMRWGKWNQQEREASVPVAVHDPVFHGSVAILSEWGSDQPHPRIASVFVGAPCDLSKGSC